MNQEFEGLDVTAVAGRIMEQYQTCMAEASKREGLDRAGWEADARFHKAALGFLNLLFEMSERSTPSSRDSAGACWRCTKCGEEFTEDPGRSHGRPVPTADGFGSEQEHCGPVEEIAAPEGETPETGYKPPVTPFQVEQALIFSDRWNITRDHHDAKGPLKILASEVRRLRAGGRDEGEAWPVAWKHVAADLYVSEPIKAGFRQPGSTAFEHYTIPLYARPVDPAIPEKAALADLLKVVERVGSMDCGCNDARIYMLAKNAVPILLALLAPSTTTNQEQK